MINKKQVFLASISFAAYEWLPYPVGCLISHAQKDKEVQQFYNFMEPEYRSNSLDQTDFHERLKQADVLGVTNWVWNQNYNDRIANIYKSYRPDGLVVYGGTNVPEEKEVAEEYAKERPFVDIFFVGPAEENFKKFLLSYEQQGIENHQGTFTHKTNSVSVGRYDHVKVPIPSPYTDGIFDDIIERETRPLSALFETNRGCPYGCAFCDWGGMTKSKIIRKDEQEVRDTISYIMGKENIDRIEIGDANFGIYAQDVEYTKHMIAEKNKRKNDINLTMGGFAKNGSKHVEDIMRLMHDNFEAYHGRKYIKLSFQSHDETTLDAVHRSNINNDKLIPMMKKFQSEGVEVDAEMIIGMPGDNEDRWLDTIQKNMDLNINHQKSFSLWIVPNTPMASKKYREKHKVKTKHIYVPYDLDRFKSKEYHMKRLAGEDIHTQCTFKDPTEYQKLEFIYECFSFDSEELMRIYDVWFWFNTLYNAKVARKWMLESNLSAKEQYKLFMKNINDGKMPFMKKCLEEFRYAVWNTLAKPEDETKVTSLYLVNFLTKFSMRGNEMVDIYYNKDKVLKELQHVYPSINFDHFGKFDEKNITKLYFVSAEVA